MHNLHIVIAEPVLLESFIDTFNTLLSIYMWLQKSDLFAFQQ